MRRATVHCASIGNAVTQGAVSLRHTEVHDRVSASSARKSIQSRLSTQSAITARFASDRAISPRSPPTLSAQRRLSSASSTHSIDGVLIVSPLKMPSFSFPPEVRRKIFGSGQGGR